ncbi:MAG: hypothetical protein JXQ27_10830 [Acidobacteria bacterium]|nr:hypothetical protein [Acidobacteriota bacterium]
MKEASAADSGQAQRARIRAPNGWPWRRIVIPGLVALGLVLVPPQPMPDVNRHQAGEPAAALHVPSGRGILPNGRLPAAEWADAAAVSVAGPFELRLKQDERYVYLGIRFTGDMHTGVELYLAAGTAPPRKLHVSAALGEAELGVAGWSDMRWGGNIDWTANAIGLIVVEGQRQVVPLEGFEFQIAKGMFTAQTWRLRIHLKRPDVFFPAASDPQQPGTWFAVSLAEAETPAE